MAEALPYIVNAVVAVFVAIGTFALVKPLDRLRRKDAEARAREAERSYDMATGEATLGRYMSEMRHNTNNALTSILGNAELLLLEPGLPASVLAQADTIRNMALRLHEIFQRFSSIEKEISVAARESSKDSAQARGAGA